MFRSDRDYAGGIDAVVGAIVVPLDMVEVDGMGDPVGLVEVSEVTEEVRVVPDSSDITLKMSVVDRIEPHQGDKESQVGLNELRSK